MRRLKTWTVAVAALAIAAAATIGVRGQDPDGGGAGGGPPAAERPAGPGGAGVRNAGDPRAARGGRQVLMKGGTAMDAAVAVGATLNMMEPQMNGIGGNGFMTVYDK